MKTFFVGICLGLGFLTVCSLGKSTRVSAQETAPFSYLPAKAHYVLPETHNNQSGYFSLCEGLDGTIYIGTTAYGENSYLVAFDPRSQSQRVVLDTHRVCGLTSSGYAAQAKIHTRNYVGPSGTVYVGSKQGYRLDENDTADYPGGYVMSYDPRTGSARNLGMPLAGQGIADVVADESRGLLYVVTCEDQHWMVGDIDGNAYQELGPVLRPYAMTLLTPDGRAHAITQDFQLATYDPEGQSVVLRDIVVGGETWQRETAHAIPTWALSPDQRSAYLILMNDATLLEIPLAEVGEVVEATEHGILVNGSNPDCRCGLDVGADGNVYAVIRVDNETGFGNGYLHHLARFVPSTRAIENLGVITVENPDFFDWEAKGKDGKPLPWTHGFHRLPDDTLTPLHSHMSLRAAHDNTLYVTIIYPFTLLAIEQFRLDRPEGPAEQFVRWAVNVVDESASPAVLSEHTRVAEIIAQRHIEGGLIGFPLYTQALAQELWGRSGGMVHVGFNRPWTEERSEEHAAHDVGIVGFDRTPADTDKDALRAFKKRGGYLVGFGPRQMTELEDIIALCDVWFDSGFGDDDRVVELDDGRRAGHGNIVANAIHGHLLFAEIVGALTRQGKMPTMWKSYSYDDGREWGERYYLKKQFHDDFDIRPFSQGELGLRFLQQIQYPIKRIGMQSNKLQVAADQIAEALSGVEKIPVAWQGHMPMSYLGKREDDQWAQPVELHPFLPQQVESFRKDGPRNSLMLSLGYHGLDPIAAELWQEKNLTVIHLAGDHANPAWRFRPEIDMNVDLGFAFGDACVSIEGYPIRLFAPSGIAQAVAYESICAELAHRR